MLSGQIKNRLNKPPTSSPEPLGREQCQHLAAMLAELVPKWSVGLQCDMHGEPSIVIMPDDLTDDVAPTLIVRTDGTAFHLGELHHEKFCKLGRHRVWADVVRAVRVKLTWETPSQLRSTDQRFELESRMSADAIELRILGERLARVRRTYGENIDLPDLEPNLFAALLGASVIAYKSYERGEKEPTVDFLIALRKKTGVSLDWLLDPDQSAPDRTFR